MKVKELRVIDSHFHFCDFPGFDQVALAAGYTNTEESLHQAFIENNVVHGVVMSKETLDAKKHNYPDYMSYCIGIDSLTGKDDMETSSVILHHRQCIIVGFIRILFSPAGNKHASGIRISSCQHSDGIRHGNRSNLDPAQSV